MDGNDTPLIECFGDTARERVLSFLLIHANSDYSVKELANNTKLTRQSVTKSLGPLLRYQLITKYRKIGHTTMFRFNSESTTAAKAIEFCDALVDVIIEEEAKKMSCMRQSNDDATGNSPQSVVSTKCL
jgi:predicted transcriptional regulator